MNTRIRQEYLDADYLAKLSDTELEFLNQFYKEHYNGSFTKDENGEFSKDNLLDASDSKVRKQIYLENNARNRDIFSTNKAMGTLMYLDHSTLEEVIESKQYTEVDSFGEAIADLIDDEKKD
jgi:hypothetical protein